MKTDIKLSNKMCKYYVFPAVSPVCTAAPRHVLYTRVYFEVHDKPVNADKDSEFCDDEHSEQVNIFEAYRMSKPPFLVGDRGFHDACPGCEREKNGKKLEVVSDALLRLFFYYCCSHGLAFIYSLCVGIRYFG